MYQLPCLDFIFECIDEVLLGEWFIFRQVYLLDEVLFLYHLAGDHFIWLGIDGEVGFGEAALAQFFIFDGVAAVYDFEGVAVLHGLFYLLGFTFHKWFGL